MNIWCSYNQIAGTVIFLARIPFAQAGQLSIYKHIYVVLLEILNLFSCYWIDLCKFGLKSQLTV